MSEAKRPECDVVKRHGRIVKVCGRDVLLYLMPDWNLLYVRFDTPDEMERLRRVLMREESRGAIRVVKVTLERIYFEERK